MKFLILLIISGVILAGGAAEPYLKKSVFMSPSAALKKFGSEKFTIEKFRSSSSAERGKMVVSLIESRRYIGKSPEQVRKDLGRFDGYLWNDSIPAYFLNEGWKTKTDTWQVVFLLNRKGLVEELRIHRNCCSK